MFILSKNLAQTQYVFISSRLVALRFFVLACTAGYCFWLLSLAPGSIKPKLVLAWLIAIGLLSGAMLKWPPLREKPSLGLSLHLLLDIITITVFVLAFGGASNPFMYYLLVNLAIGASILPSVYAWGFCGLAIAIYSFVMLSNFGQNAHHVTGAFSSHLIGMWVNFCGSAFTICFFITRLSRYLQQKDEALAEARERSLKQEQLIGIGTLAASTLHSFGTPLSSIGMCVAEIRNLVNGQGVAAPGTSDEAEAQSLINYTEVIEQQVATCKATMSKLASYVDVSYESAEYVNIKEIIADLEQHFSVVSSIPMPVFDIKCEMLPDFADGLLLKHAFINLIENAVRAAKSYVGISVDRDGQDLCIFIDDDGEGVESFDTSAFGGGRLESSQGMGIGIFLANSTIERAGGEISFQRESGGAGTFTRIAIRFTGAYRDAVL